MIKELELLYLKPNHWGYHLLEAARCHWLKISLALFTITCFYPALQNVQAFRTQQGLTQELQHKQENLQQQNRLLATLQQRQQEKTAQDGQLAELNQQIKNLVDKEKAMIDTIQWRFDNGRQIDLILLQQSHKMFRLIDQLATVQSLQFKEISLLKLNRQKLVQLNAEISVQ